MSEEQPKILRAWVCGILEAPNHVLEITVTADKDARRLICREYARICPKVGQHIVFCESVSIPIRPLKASMLR
jgi:phosphoribosyl-dephospho-CoA transferase